MHSQLLLAVKMQIDHLLYFSFAEAWELRDVLGVALVWQAQSTSVSQLKIFFDFLNVILR